MDKNAKLSQILGDYCELTDELGRMKLQYAAGVTVSDDLKFVTVACEPPTTRAKLLRQCKSFFTTFSTAAFLDPPAERDNFKSRSETLALEYQCMFGLALEAKELREMLADHEKPDAATKTTLKGRRKRRATDAEKRMDALEAELTDAKAAHAHLADIYARSEAGAKKARADLEGLRMRLCKLEWEAELAGACLDEAPEQSIGSMVCLLT